MLNQDYPYDRCEIILVDGMSTDRPRELVQAMAGKRDVAVRIVDKHLHPSFTYRYSVKVSNGMSRMVEWSGTEEGERGGQRHL
jgi:glycosyltransferase involved in cell wall biosynthesis